jgi:hypothetical protein
VELDQSATCSGKVPGTGTGKDDMLIASFL